MTDVANRPACDFPSVSIIVPVLNEARHIEACLQSIMAQDYPRARVEILVVDGMSTDATPVIVRACAAGDPRILLLFSPKRRTPFSMNIGLAASTGEVIVRIDGHSVVGPDHVRRCVEYLLSSGADHVGGVMRARGNTYVARTIAAALSSPFGVGSARFRYTTREQDIDTVPFGAYRRDTIIGLGGFDERFLICQDSELDYRIILSGGRVRVTPATSTDYYCRTSLRLLAHQFFRYGRGKAFILHKHGGLPSPRAMVPATFLSCIGLLALAAPFRSWARGLLRALLIAYAAGCLVASAVTAATRGWRYLALLPVTFATLHVSHGMGFLSALPRFLTPRPVERLRGSLDVASMGRDGERASEESIA